MHERIAAAIEMTRFPVPDGEAYAATETEGALVRAADLIGQMADPFYHRKINALYLEFVETGAAEALGYNSAADLIDKYPEFFWNQVQPIIGPALGYLELTTEGKQWIAALNSNVFQIEHQPPLRRPVSRARLGSVPGEAGAPGSRRRRCSEFAADELVDRDASAAFDGEHQEHDRPQP